MIESINLISRFFSELAIPPDEYVIARLLTIKYPELDFSERQGAVRDCIKKIDPEYFTITENQEPTREEIVREYPRYDFLEDIEDEETVTVQDDDNDIEFELEPDELETTSEDNLDNSIPVRLSYQEKKRLLLDSISIT